MGSFIIKLKGAAVVMAVFSFTPFALAQGQSVPPKISVACLKNERTPNVDGNFCAATLPKCSELLNGAQGSGAGGNSDPGIIKNIKNLLSWKIYGLRRHLDLDLNASKFENNSFQGLVGGKFDQPVCSVVGDKLAVGSQMDSIPTAELSKQKIGIQGSCGKPPRYDRSDKFGANADFSLVYDKDSGSLWTAYMYGAMEWVIRKKAYDVLSKLNAESLANLNSILGQNQDDTKGAIISLAGHLKEMNDVVNNLSAAEKASCNLSGGELKNKCLNLKVDDPASRICKLQQARAIANRGAIANIIALSIVEAAEEDYRKLFGAFLTSNKDLEKFFDACTQAGRSADSQRGKRAAAIACVQGVLDEQDGKNWYCVSGGHRGSDVAKGACETEQPRRRSAWLRAMPAISDPAKLAYVMEFRRLREREVERKSFYPRDASYAINSGFAGFVESQIRRYCGQQKVSDRNVCDDIGIPTIPEGVTDHP